MRLAPIQPPGPDASPKDVKDFHDKREAANAFESIFVRKMLSSLEKTASPTAGSNGSGGEGGGANAIYGSMMVDSMADAIVKSGGIGLSDMILRAMAPAGSAPKK